VPDVDPVVDHAHGLTADIYAGFPIPLERSGDTLY